MSCVFPSPCLSVLFYIKLFIFAPVTSEVFNEQASFVDLFGCALYSKENLLKFINFFF